VWTACYLINIFPSAPLEGDVLERFWTRKDVSCFHLRVIGCKAYVHVLKEQRTKPHDKFIPCIFLSYGSDEIGYILWVFKNKKVIRSRDVVFCEGKMLPFVF